MRKLIAAFATLCMLPACSSDGPTSGHAPSVRVLAGANVTDTVLTRPVQGLVAQVRDASARPMAGVEVRFESAQPGRVRVGAVSSPYIGEVVGVTTDADGRATVRVAFGAMAGEGWVRILVPLHGLADSARYTVRPGAAVGVWLLPRDTTLTVGSTFTYRGSTIDAYGNPRQDPATFHGVGAAVGVTASGTVTALDPGVATVVVTATAASGSVTDQGRVAVMPAATVAWSSNLGDSPLYVSDLTGNGTMLAEIGLAPSWEPGGQRLVANRTSRLILVTMNGTITTLTTGALTDTSWPEWSADGQWIYFHGNVEWHGTRIARVRPDGTDVEVIAPDHAGQMPTPAPDGRSVAFVNSGRIAVADLESGAVRVLDGTVGALAPRWSPDGSRIAYTRGGWGQIETIRPDGTDLRIVSDATVSPGISWSPDSRWIIGTANGITIFEVATGAAIRTGWWGSYPAWKR